MPLPLDPAACLPVDADRAALVGRAHRPGLGPSVVAVRAGLLFDVTRAFPTVADLTEAPDPAAALRAAGGEPLGPLGPVLANTPPDARDPARPHLLAPLDLHALKAAGVTFAASLVERVIEERAGGDPAGAAAAREEVERLLGGDLRRVRPGSEEAAALKAVLAPKGLWSPYLEVGLGPDAEVFTEAQPLAAVGTGMDCGVHPDSAWNNPEPEAVIVIASTGRIVGATLGNDVNLRDVEGRSALLLGRAKDNRAACAIGPFARLFDEGYGLDDLRGAEVSLRVEGEDGHVLTGASSLALISRDPADLAAQAVGAHHDFPDGLALFLGTMFAPTQDRGAPGLGFTHRDGDVVTISSPRLGALVNRVRPTTGCEPWTLGARGLMRALAARGVLAGRPHPAPLGAA